MPSLDTFFRWPGSSLTGSGRLDSRGADQTGTRLAVMAALISALLLVAIILRLAVPEIRHYDRLGQIHTGSGPLVGLLLPSVAIAIVFWHRKIPERTVIAVGLIYQVFICLGASFEHSLFSLRESQVLPSTTFCEVLIVFFPLLVPSRPLVTLAAALLSGATRPLAAVLASHYESIPLESAWLLKTTVPPIAAAALAVVGSSIVFGLRLRVKRATRIGSYQLEEMLGRGGMGEVWRASHQLLPRKAAIKFVHNLPDDDAKRAKILERFEREALAIAELKSPHTVELYDYGRAEDGSFYYVMELLEGIDLHRLVERYGSIQPERAVHFARQLCRSLSEAHAAGLVHRDIKPSNLLTCRFGLAFDHLKVVDFGLVGAVRRPTSGPPITGIDQTIGTPAFISPEAAMGQRIDHRADIYAVGCVVYWLVTGDLVFPLASPTAMAVAHATVEPVPLSQASEWDVGDELSDLVTSCLAKDPAQRPQTATELSVHLSEIAVHRRWTMELAERWWDRHRPLETTTTDD